MLLNIGLVLLSALSSQAHEIDLKHLPLGDGKISTSPKRGWIWACRVDPDAGGASVNGPWIKDDGTFDFTAKAVVPGSVSWPHQFLIRLEEKGRHFIANDYPDHPTGEFPIPSSSEAYKYDQNPNRIEKQSMELLLPSNPTLAAQPSCAPGAVGILLSGSVLFSALDGPGRDAVAHETQDKCQGHPQVSGVYHYHSVSSCVPDKTDKTGHSQLVGYALDGFGIFGHKTTGGKTLTSADLDECHGHTHEIDWDGKKVVMYHYHATWDFPYTVGCFRGAYRMQDVRMISGPPPFRGDLAAGMPPNDGPRGRERPHPDLSRAARELGIAESALREALGPPPPDLGSAAARLGIPLQRLREALDHARR